MNSLILVVEDDENLLYNLKLSLEYNQYRVITANNGVKALEILSKLQEGPEIILSDITMPKMNGYDFFKAVSINPKWNQIPFLFLSGLSSIDDVRFGKMLGVDDYITKPYEDADLLAIISGKITRNKKTRAQNKKVIELFNSLNIVAAPSISEEERKLVILIFVIWDDYSGPTVKSYFPVDQKLPISVRDLGQQLFQSTISIYGQNKINKAEGALLNIENIKKYGYIFFDSYTDNTARSKERTFMLAVIAPMINYFESLKIKVIFKEISALIKEKKDFEIQKYWKSITNILVTSTI